MKKTAENRVDVAGEDEILELLTDRARTGNVQAMKALLSWHEARSDAADEPTDDWSAIYGDNVTPITRKAG